jgi:HAE1 family hydrophobic/amphiphilic exporter-1
VGTAIVGGMLFSTVLNLIFIPVLYVILKTWLAKLSAGRVKEVDSTAEELAA